MNNVTCYYGVLDASQTPYIKNVNFGENAKTETFISNLSNVAIEELSLSSVIFRDLSLLKNLKASKDTLTSIFNSSTYSSYYYREQTGDLSSLSEFTKLESIFFAGAKNSNILKGSSQLKAVKLLNVS